VQGDLRLLVHCEPAAPSVVRRALADHARLGWAIGDAMLVASELVTNAVRHSGAAPGDMVEVEVQFRGETVRVAVCDPGSSGARAVMRPARVAFGGLGLRLVEELSLRWGAQRLPDGRQLVWAEVPLEPAVNFSAEAPPRD